MKVKMPRRSSSVKRPSVNRPYVVANFAITWDGRISTVARTPSNFSSSADKKRFLEIRAEGDAVVAGYETVRADTMTMGISDSRLRELRVSRGQAAYPLRVVVSGGGEVDSGLRLFGETFSPVVVYTTQRMPLVVRESLEGCAGLRFSEGERVDVAWMLASLRQEFEVKRVVFEGGGALFASFLRARCVDELCLTLCPVIFGGREGVTLSGTLGEWLPKSVECSLLSMEVLDGECFTRWRLNYRNKIAETVDSLGCGS